MKYETNVREKRAVYRIMDSVLAGRRGDAAMGSRVDVVD
jgi:hypothetical protein